MRSTDAFVEILRPMLVSSRSLKIIDPYISRMPDARFTDPILALLRTATNRANGSRLRVLEIHTSTASSNPAAWDIWKGNFETEFRRTFATFASSDVSFEVFVWEKKPHGRPDPHNRFIISNAIGVQLGVGVDESPVSDEEDDWCVMEESHREQVALRYSRSTTVFRRVHDFKL